MRDNELFTTHDHSYCAVATTIIVGTTLGNKSLEKARVYTGTAKDCYTSKYFSAGKRLRTINRHAFGVFTTAVKQG